MGRADELSRAVAAITSTAGVAVVGEAGAGKTALLSQALHRAGRPVLAGQCFRSLAWTAGLPLQQAVGRLIPAGDPAWTAQWVSRACGSAVLWLDDLQWADPLTLSVVALLAPTVTFAATVRLGDPGAAAALQAAAEAGTQLLELPPLAPDDAVDLALHLHPRMRRSEARALAERCAGNPLLIEELGADPEPSVGLRRSVTARLRRLGPVAWRGFALLALADEPLPRSWLPEAPALVQAGFAVLNSDDDTVRPRHLLLAEVVAAELAERAPEESTALHLELARRAEHGGHLALAARGYAAGGEREPGLRCALQAAEETARPGERASLLHLAASCAAGTAGAPSAAELATRAVEELVVAGDYSRAATLLEELPDVAGARWFGLVGRVRWQLGDDDGALAAFEAGLKLAQPGSDDGVLLQIEHARAVLIGLGDGPRGLVLARAAYERAETVGVERARALSVLGTAEHYAGIDGDREHLAQAMTTAAQDGDVMVEFTSANNLIAVHESGGRGAEACALAQQFAARADELHMRGWQQQMQAMAFNAQLHLGEYDPIVSGVPRLLSGSLDRRTRDQLEVTLGLALIDLGRHEVVMNRLDSAIESCVPDYQGLGNLLWVRSEAYFWAGDAETARETVLTALDHTPPDGRRLFALVTLAHTDVQLGRPVEPRDWPEPHARILAGAPLELAGLAALSNGDKAAAALHFAAAAGAWAGYHRRGELRSRWLAADALGDEVQACVLLQALERELVDDGLAPLLGRVRRSLRLRGVRSAAPRGRAGDLTAREREVLDLVAEGLSTEAIAARLGLAPSTVAAQIASARTRRGASTRWQAASG